MPEHTLDCQLMLTIDGHDAEWEATAEYEVIPATRGMMRGEPDEPAYAQVYKVTAFRLAFDDVFKRHVPDSKVVDITALLSRAQIAALEEQAIKDHNERMQPPEREYEAAD